VPGAVNEPTKTTPGASDTAEVIETPETLKRSEADEIVKILEGIQDKPQNTSRIKGNNPSKQLQVELAVRIAITPIPKPKEANPIKLV
jgi:cell division GTPase FtsZ